MFLVVSGSNGVVIWVRIFSVVYSVLKVSVLFLF